MPSAIIVVKAEAESLLPGRYRGADFRCRLACLPRMPSAIIVVKAEAENPLPGRYRGADVWCRLACLLDMVWGGWHNFTCWK